MNRQSLAMVLAGLMMICETAYADGAADVLSAFTKSVSNRKLSAEVETSVESILTTNAESPATAITESLIAIYPEYGQAIDDADFEGIDVAVEALTPLTTHEDQFLAADANFHLARTLMNAEKYEDAVPLLKKITGKQGKYSAHQGVATYYTGVAQAGMLDNEAAIKSFATYLQFNSDIADRLRESAWVQIQALQQIEKGKLSDIRQRMNFSRRRLKLTETDADTQNQQQQIVTMLGTLIAVEEKKEQNQQKSGQQQEEQKQKQQEKKENSSDNQKQSNKQEQKQQGEKKPNQSESQSGGSSSNPNGVAQLKTYDGSPASPWSRLRERSRDGANNAFKDKLPARYRELVEKYNNKADGDN